MIRNLEAHYDACCVLMMAFHDSMRLKLGGKGKRGGKKKGKKD
jgi:hypothetical protein